MELWFIGGSINGGNLTDELPYFSYQFILFKRLHYVIVSLAVFAYLHNIRSGCGEQDHRYLFQTGIGLEALAKLVTAHFREQQVQKDKIGYFMF